MSQDLKEKVSKCFKTYPDFPVVGVQFLDIMGIFLTKDIIDASVQMLADMIKNKGYKFEYIAGIEARGFLLGVPLAQKLNVGFIPIRKRGKLPGSVLSIASSKEYGADVLEIQDGKHLDGASILIFDDVFATGGSVSAACNLLKKTSAKVVGCAIFVELSYLKGRKSVECEISSVYEFNNKLHTFN